MAQQNSTTIPYLKFQTMWLISCSAVIYGRLGFGQTDGPDNKQLRFCINTNSYNNTYSFNTVQYER